MAWNGDMDSLPMMTLPAGTVLHHGTDCDGDFEAPDGPAWFCETQEGAAYWAGWNTPAHGHGDGERRTHAFVTTVDVLVIDIVAAGDTDEDWTRLSEAISGVEDDYLTRNELADGLVERGHLGWSGHGEVMLANPSSVLAFTGRTVVPGENPMRPEPSTYRPQAQAA